MKNAFYSMLKALFVLKIFNFCPDIFGHVRGRLHVEVKINFKIDNIADWEKNNYNRSKSNQTRNLVS